MFAENILVEKILKSYLKRLTNLSSRNKSLVLLNLSQEQFLDIHELDFLQNKPSFSIIEALIARKNTIPLCEILDSRYERNNAISQQLKRISRTEKFIEEERGSKDLYVGYPFVRGKFADGTVVCGPLFFFPVTLQQQAQKWVLQSLSDEPISFNRSLLLAYSHFNQVKILDEFLEKNLEDFDTDSLVFRTQLYDYLKDSSLSVNFNQELLASQLQFFEKILKSDLEETERNGELKLYAQAVLGIFPQSGSYLVPDYEWLLNLTRSVEPPQPSLLWKGGNVFCPSSPLERRLGGGDASSEVSEVNSLTPFPIDASQEAAFVRVKNGESLVIQGPPGTGKSQLICNLIADFAARGKRVLLICQKRVALDVVYERLAQAGMSQFVALVHDLKMIERHFMSRFSTKLRK